MTANVLAQSGGQTSPGAGVSFVSSQGECPSSYRVAARRDIQAHKEPACRALRDWEIVVLWDGVMEKLLRRRMLYDGGAPKDCTSGFCCRVQRLALILLITLDHSFPVWLKNWFIKK